MLQAMGAGSVDIGGVGDAPPIFAAAGGSQIAVVSALQANPDGTAHPGARRTRRSTRSPSCKRQEHRGRAGQLVQLPPARGPDQGRTQRSRTYHPDYLQPADAQAAFSAGHVAAWDIWSPFIEQAESQYHARVLANGAASATTYSFVVASRAALGDPAKAAAIKDYLQLLDQAYTWAAQHQSAWAATWAKATGLPLAVMMQAVKDYQTTPVADHARRSSAPSRRVANAFTTAGLIPQKINFSNFAVTTFNSVLGGSS